MTVSMFVEGTGELFYMGPTIYWMAYASQLIGRDEGLYGPLFEGAPIHRTEALRIVGALADDLDHRITEPLLEALDSIVRNDTMGILDVGLSMASDKAEPMLSEDEDENAVAYAEQVVNKAFLHRRGQDILDALLEVTVPDSFQSFRPAQARKAMETLIEAMVQEGGWSVSEVIARLKDQFPAVERWRLARIVRTESERVSLRSQELELIENDPPMARYRWGGSLDDRTCPVHRAILERQPDEGLTMDGLKALIAQTANEFGYAVYDDWMVHPNQRGRIMRVFQ